MVLAIDRNEALESAVDAASSLAMTVRSRVRFWNPERAVIPSRSGAGAALLGFGQIFNGWVAVRKVSFNTD